MLDSIFAKTALSVRPEISFGLNSYRKRIETLTGYRYNTAGECAELTFAKIEAIQRAMERLSVLSNAVDAAVALLNDRQRRLIDLVYFKGQPREAVMAEMKLSPTQYKYLKNVSVKKIAGYLNILGFDNERFLAYFNAEPAVVRNYEILLLRRAACCFGGDEDVARSV